MVARIAASRNLSAILNYNEKKVTRGDADLIHASGFLKDPDRLNFYEKLERFQRLNDLNTRTAENMLHISLNFDRSEQLSKEQLAAISDRYMAGIGLKDQPYLVYQHKDADHPHIHIVANIIQPDGKRLDTHRMAREKSEPIRKEIEKDFGLVPAESRRSQKRRYELPAVDVTKVVYANAAGTKQAMTHAIREVFTKYKYASLPEYTAALRQYNVTADRGGKDSRIRNHGGLVYRVLDEQGNKVGVPIKSSLFHFKPTLPNVEQNFEKNRTDREQYLPSIRNRIDIALLQNLHSLREFVEQLKAERIELVIRQNDTGRVYGLTYVDRETKTVVNGSSLGKEYGAAGILRHFQEAQTPGRKTNQTQNKANNADEPILPLVPGFNHKAPQILSNLMQYEESFGRSPYELEEEQKIRRRPLR